MEKRVLLLLSLMFLGVGCSSQQPRFEVVNNSLHINLSGYTQTCQNNYKLQIIEGEDKWRKTENGNLLKGEIYLGNATSSNIWLPCDLVVCEKINGFVEVPLKEYVKTGEKISMIDKHSLVPVYNEVNLKGKLKVNYNYFLDDKCLKPEVFEIGINN